MIRRLVPVLCGFLLTSHGCSLPKDTAAEVNGRRILAAALDAEYQNFLTQFGQLPPALGTALPKLRRGVLERLVDREIMLQEAQRRGLRPTPEEIEQALRSARGGMQEQELDATLSAAGSDRERWRQAIERDLTLEKLQRAVTATVTVGDKEIADWRARHRDHHEHPEEVRAAQILVRTREEALAARQRILGGASFSTVAQQVSLSPDAGRGGDLGYFSRGQMPPEFDETVFTLPAGRLSDVVETAYGYHLFLVTDRRPARARSEAEIGAEVRAALIAEKKDAAFRAWLKGLRSAAKIRYNVKVVPP